VAKYYSEGKLEAALSLAILHEKEEPKLLEQTSFLLLYAKLLLETEGPGSKTRGLIGKAYLIEPENPEILDYLELTEAKHELSHGIAEDGLKRLKNLTFRSPHNPHALFILGGYLFWSLQLTIDSTRYLQRCVGLRPTFLRAWACLGAIYLQNGDLGLADKAFRKCVSLETNPQMKEFFKRQLELTSSKAA